MARSRRIDYPGAWHHVMHRGRHRERIYWDDDDALTFLETLGEVVEGFGLEVHAYSLMPNHYHLLVRSPRATLSRSMRHLNGVFTQRVNRRHGWDGTLFRGRFRSRLVEDESYLRYLVAYIHLNPVRAHLVRRPDDLCWTSHRALVGLEAAPPWLSTWVVRHVFGTGRQLDEFVRSCHLGRESWPEDLSLDQGWLPANGQGTSCSPGASAETKPQAGATRAAEILARICEVTGATEDELRTARKGQGANCARRFAVYVLAAEPDLLHRDVGSLLDMSTRQVGNVLYDLRRKGLPREFLRWREGYERGASEHTSP